MLEQLKMSISKFILLCWKNWTLFKRRPIACIFELLLPTAIFLAVLLTTKLTYVKSTELFSINVQNCVIDSRRMTQLYYTPITKETEVIMDQTSERLSLSFKGFATEKELYERLDMDRSDDVVVVVFDATTSSDTKHLKYTIRMPDCTSSHNNWKIIKMDFLEMSTELRPNSLSHPDSIYFSSCFLMLQNEIDHAFIKSVSDGTARIDKLKTLGAFLYPTGHADISIVTAVYLFPILFVLSVIFPIYELIKNITMERESGLTESMKLMGLSSALYWSSWFMRSFIILVISFTINIILTVTSIISDVPMFINSNSFIIWIFFISYITSMITFCFLVSVIFKKSSRAGIIGSIVFIVTVLPYMMYHDNFYRFTYGLKVLFCMLTNTNMAQGIKMILMAEINQNGIGFGNLFKKSLDINFSFGELLIFINIGSALQMIATVYIEKVFPGDYGISKPYYYPLKYIYSRFIKESIDIHEANHQNGIEMDLLCLPSDQEQVPKGLYAGIELKNLSIQFDNNQAVQNLSLNIYQNQITTLLDITGTGKTALISMLSGQCIPTSGTAIINGYDIKTHADEARRSMGVYMQHDVYFEELTVKENLEFFCKLKGMTVDSTIQNNIQRYTEMLGIADISDNCKELSKEQKRKLSIAIALCGDSKFIIMDEPAAGMDPSSRRHLWDLLIVEKHKRTILITTQFWDEAEDFSDRIAIMSEGQLRTVGSSSELHTKFNTGYRLTCVKRPGFFTNFMCTEIQKLEPKSSLISDSEMEAVFVIPKVSQIHKISKRIEGLDIMCTDNIRCSYFTLEDAVHRSICDDFQNDIQDVEATDCIVAVDDLWPGPEKCDQRFLIFQQFYAMFLKKFHVFCQSWKLFLILIIISVIAIFLIPNMLYIESIKITKLQITLNSYEGTETLVESDQNSDIFRAYSSLLTGKDIIVISSTNIEDEIVKKDRKVNHMNLIAATFKTNSIIAWFNTQLYHTMPLTINTVNRAILKSVVGNDYDITVTNHPYTYTQHSAQNSSPILLILSFLIIWPLIYIGHNIKERVMKFKFQLFISGTNRLVYWITNLIFDYLLFVLICLVLFGCIAVSNFDNNQFRMLMTVGSSYGFSWICFIYAFSYLFTKSSTGRSMLLLMSIILLILSIVGNKLELLSINQYWMIAVNICDWILMIFAPFTLPKMLDDVYSGTRPDIIGSTMMNIMSGCIFFLIVILHDYNFYALIYYKFKSSPGHLVQESQSLDLDVHNESLESNLVLKNLTKLYKGTAAVNQLSLNVKQHECFGLLGINGAGKTTTFKMMTGDELITSGDIWIKGKCLKTQLLDAHKFIGYCPQFDNCIPELTGRETLKIFALIRGIKMDQINELVNQMSSELDFKQHLDKQVRAYSGGNRRKLSTALALLGNPELIFLDECTTGVDPQARRQIWNAIKRIRDNHRLSSSIVITSHSMDECEALCTRIGIMVDGQFQCLGPVQHLKNKFSKGFVLTVKTGFTDEEMMTNLRELIVRKFLDVELKRRHNDCLEFHLTNVEMKYSEIFMKLEEIKVEMGIEDYKLTQMSLEQVYLNNCKQGTPFSPGEVHQIRKQEAIWRKEESELSQLNWIWKDSFEHLPVNPICAGSDADGDIIYVGKCNHKGHSLPATVIPNKMVAIVTNDGSAIVKKEFKILCGVNTKWVPSSHGSHHPNAVVGGHAANGEKLYIGRARWQDCLTCGKIQPSKKLLYIPYGGREIPIENYEILIELE
ncbi:phospholipid-transporting ATPase ABCA3-like isoform X2 [Chironomus tepperi]|uniref:phospholipid-transporting ATPase ABCA3-like isoform X2 n=1 Tax=Chironomus tepperi TaxID=113505 RepID=UPI00391F4B35